MFRGRGPKKRPQIQANLNIFLTGFTPAVPQNKKEKPSERVAIPRTFVTFKINVSTVAACNMFQAEKCATRVVTCFQTLKKTLSFYLKNDDKFSQPWHLCLFSFEHGSHISYGRLNLLSFYKCKKEKEWVI